MPVNTGQLRPGDWIDCFHTPFKALNFYGFYSNGQCFTYSSKEVFFFNVYVAFSLELKEYQRCTQLLEPRDEATVFFHTNNPSGIFVKLYGV